MLPVQSDKRVKQVQQLDIEDNMVGMFKSIAEASRATGINKTCIAKVCRGERKTSNGYV